MINELLKNIFSFEKDEKTQILTIKIFGIKFKKNLFKIKMNSFLKQNQKYNKKNSNNTVKRRLFLTTGNLSLLNTITAIKQLNEPNCYDVLVVISHLTNDNFEKSIKIMSSLHDFKEVYTQYGDARELNIRNKLFIDNNLYNFDEIYFSNQELYICITNDLYKYSKWIMIEEGPNGKFNFPEGNYKKVSKMIMHEYLDNKIDSFGFSDEIKKKIIPLDKSIFLDVANSCAKKCPVNINTKEDEKIILLCGLWWENTGLTKEEYIELQESYIEKFLDKGYTIWFKPHPRDGRDYIKNDKVKVLETALPLECYKFSNVVATVSFLSTSSLFSYYFSNIPGFQIKMQNMQTNNRIDTVRFLVKKIVQDYAPPIEYLLDLDTKHLSLFETKEKIKNIYLSYMKNLPKISENKELLKLANELGYKVC